ncbi:MAG: GNAT family N-acetyltransferase [Mycobacteriaceae bacterium]|nr:GNAT family N-acetyltransferase [Mycobacteriaceae bacterium]
MSLGLRPARRSDVRAVAGLLGRAFYDDPVTMWIVPDNDRRAAALPRMFATMTRHHFLAGGGAEVATHDEVIGGATLWDPPGRWKTTQRQGWLMKPAFLWAFRGRARAGEQVTEMMTEHHPEEPHWYLMFIGTDPTARGKGLGQALLHSRLDRCDEEHAPAYLEASKKDLVPYYSRFGFEVTGEIRLPRNGPSLWPMWRAPR